MWVEKEKVESGGVEFIYHHLHLRVGYITIVTRSDAPHRQVIWYADGETDVVVGTLKEAKEKVYQYLLDEADYLVDLVKTLTKDVE